MIDVRVGFVMPGLVPGIHAAERSHSQMCGVHDRIDFAPVEDGGQTWMAGTSPARTAIRRLEPYRRNLI
jgi:hypothetical protein